MRGALEPLPGVASIDVKPGRKEVYVEYDAARVTTERMLQALAEKKEPAQLAR